MHESGRVNPESAAVAPEIPSLFRCATAVYLLRCHFLTGPRDGSDGSPLNNGTAQSKTGPGGPPWSTVPIGRFSLSRKLVAAVGKGRRISFSSSLAASLATEVYSA